MEQLTSMKITGITLSNFRRFTEEKHFDLGDISCVFGHNGSGKTTLAHAVCYALYGVTYYGEQKIERLMNENSKDTSVQLQFSDQNGDSHTLIRKRIGDKTSLFYDGFTVTQSEIEAKFCDKNTFLSMFNPFYLTEQMGDTQGRSLVLKYLKPVSNDAVLSEIGDFAKHLEGIDLSKTPVDELLKMYRSECSRCEKQLLMLEGRLSEINGNSDTSSKKLDELYELRGKAQDSFELLQKKQFCGIDLDEIAIQRDVLTNKLAGLSTASNPKLDELKAKLIEAKQRVYVPKFEAILTEARTEAKMLGDKLDKITAKLEKLKPGIKCPTCLTAITEENIENIKANLLAERQKIVDVGKGVVERGKEAQENEQKAKAVFEKYREDDILSYEAQISELQKENEVADAAAVKEKLDELESKQKYGNLTAEEYGTLVSLKSSIADYSSQIKALEESGSEERLKEIADQKAAFNTELQKYKNVISALSEFAAKRTALATESIKMPNVSIRLYDVFRTTGEVKNTFKFDYKGRDYSTLSLSEKTLAGIEISAMMRKLTGIDCPICVDNTESVASFNNVPMPTQTMLIRFVKGEELQVRVKTTPHIVSGNAELKKAS